MKTHDDGGPAFPVVHAIVPQPGHYTYAPEAQPGMTLRDYFAAAAVAGVVAAYSGPDIGLPGPCVAAKAAYQIADAMLAERKTTRF